MQQHSSLREYAHIRISCILGDVLGTGEPWGNPGSMARLKVKHGSLVMLVFILVPKSIVTPHFS